MLLWSEIRRRVKAGELSLRQAARHYQLNFRTVQKIVESQEPPSFHQARPRQKPVLDPFLPILRQILQEDRHAPPKQRHTARRIYERLRDEHDYPGCSSIVRAAVAAFKQSQAEVFVPLAHPPGEAQCDYGRAEVVIAGTRHKAALTHHVDPDVDRERDALVGDLRAAGAVEAAWLAPWAGPTRGRNGEGDCYFTGGDMAVAVLRRRCGGGDARGRDHQPP